MVYQPIDVQIPDINFDDAELRALREPLASPPRPDNRPFPLADMALELMTRPHIEAAVAVAPKLHISGEEHAPFTAVARISADIIVKYGSDSTLRGEARTMLYVQEHTDVAMPHVYQHWESQLESQGRRVLIFFIVMQYVQGKPLADEIDILDKDTQEELRCQLHEGLTALHSLHGFIPGPVGGGRATAPTVFTTDGAGPFMCIDDLTAWLNGCLQLCRSYGKAVPLPPFDEDIKELVMCHLDLHARNFIIDASRKLWFIDWGCAGFYPRSFEYVCMQGAVRLMHGVRSYNGASNWLAPVTDATATPEGKRLAEKLDRIGYAINR